MPINKEMTEQLTEQLASRGLNPRCEVKTSAVEAYAATDRKRGPKSKRANR